MARLRHVPDPDQSPKGKVVSSNSAVSKALPVAGAPGNAAFWLMTHPQRWVYRDGAFRPRLSRFKLKPGLRNISKDPRTGRLQVDLAIAGMTRKGWKILRNGDPKLGDDADYLVEFENTAGGKVYRSKWEIPRVLGTTTYWGTDLDEQDTCMDRWIKDGVIDPIDPAIAEGLIMVAESRVRHLEDLLVAQPGNGAVMSRHERAKARLEEMQDAYDTLISLKSSKVKKSTKASAKPKAANVDSLLEG